MKKGQLSFFRLPLIIAVAVYFFICCFTPEEPSFDNGLLASCTMQFTNEEPVNMTNLVVDTASGEQRVLNFQQVVSTSANANLPLLVDSVYSDAFCKLKDSADVFQNRDTACKNYITALKICYGLHANYGSIRLLYQPVYLCNISGKQSYKVKSTGFYFKYHSGSKSFIYTTDTSTIKNYLDSILVVRTSGSAPTHFLLPPSNNDTLGDARSVIFTFQEIAALIADNQTQYVKFWNAVRQVPVVSAGQTLNKHDLLLGPVQLRVPLTAVTYSCGSAAFCNKFADLGSLCPPSCLITSQ